MFFDREQFNIKRTKSKHVFVLVFYKINYTLTVHIESYIIYSKRKVNDNTSEKRVYYGNN